MSPGEKFSLNLGKTLDGNLSPKNLMYPDPLLFCCFLFLSRLFCNQRKVRGNKVMHAKRDIQQKKIDSDHLDNFVCQLQIIGLR